MRSLALLTRIKWLRMQGRNREGAVEPYCWPAMRIMSNRSTRTSRRSTISWPRIAPQRASRSYEKLTDADRDKLAGAVNTLAEDLSQLTGSSAWAEHSSNGEVAVRGLTTGSMGVPGLSAKPQLSARAPPPPGSPRPAPTPAPGVASGACAARISVMLGRHFPQRMRWPFTGRPADGSAPAAGRRGLAAGGIVEAVADADDHRAHARTLTDQHVMSVSRTRQRPTHFALEMEEL